MGARSGTSSVSRAGGQKEACPCQRGAGLTLDGTCVFAPSGFVAVVAVDDGWFGLTLNVVELKDRRAVGTSGSTGDALAVSKPGYACVP